MYTSNDYQQIGEWGSNIPIWRHIIQKNNITICELIYKNNKIISTLHFPSIDNKTNINPPAYNPININPPAYNPININPPAYNPIIYKIKNQ
jgi:hypothetical protein